MLISHALVVNCLQNMQNIRGLGAPHACSTELQSPSLLNAASGHDWQPVYVCVCVNRHSQCTCIVCQLVARVQLQQIPVSLGHQVQQSSVSESNLCLGMQKYSISIQTNTQTHPFQFHASDTHTQTYTRENISKLKHLHLSPRARQGRAGE